jgi:hypothetical protein
LEKKRGRHVKGCHTFNTPAPLLQELGLNNLTTHTASCITESYTHGQLYYGKLHTRKAVLIHTRKAVFSVLKADTEAAANDGKADKSFTAANDGKADKSIAERLFELAGYRDISATAFMVRSNQPTKCVDKKVYIPLFINGYRTTW